MEKQKNLPKFTKIQKNEKTGFLNFTKIYEKKMLILRNFTLVILPKITFFLRYFT
jgi:hypothetical protein